MPYNLTGITTNTTGMLSLVQNINNELMGGWMIHLFLIGLGIVMFTSFMVKTNDMKQSLAGTMFLLFTISLGFLAVQLVHPIAVFITLVGSAISVMLTFSS